MSLSQKRSSKHFTPTEKKLLVQILQKYKDIIENKKTDGSSVKAKIESWKKITDEFNSSSIITEEVCDVFVECNKSIYHKIYKINLYNILIFPILIETASTNEKALGESKTCSTRSFNKRKTGSSRYRWRASSGTCRIGFGHPDNRTSFDDNCTNHLLVKYVR